jgi:S-ribosylhomocysteine lyase
MHSLEGAKKVAKHILDSNIVIMDNKELALDPDKIQNICNVNPNEVKVLGR